MKAARIIMMLFFGFSATVSVLLHDPARAASAFAGGCFFALLLRELGEDDDPRR